MQEIFSCVAYNVPVCKVEMYPNLKTKIFFNDGPQLCLESAKPAWYETLLVIEDNTFDFDSWRFSMGIPQCLQLRLKEGNKDFKRKLRVLL